MKLGSEDKKKLAILAVAGTGALGAVVYMASQLFTSSPSAPPPSVAPVATTTPSTTRPAVNTTSSSATTPVVPGGHPVATTAAALDPTLHMGPMLVTESLQYRGSGRNIFSTTASAPSVAALPRPIASARPNPTQIASTAPVAPSGPPPIDLRFFGTASRPNKPNLPIRAFLLRGDEVYLAGIGDVVQRRYKILAITANSLTVQDLSNNNQQTLALATN